MLNRLILNLLIVPCILPFFSCNPDCNNSRVPVSAEISPNIRLLDPNVETQIHIQTNPGDYLASREIFIEKIIDGNRQIDETPLQNVTYSATGRGSIITLPKDAAGTTTFYVKDDDCGGFIPLSTTNIVDESFALNNRSFFVTPTPPLITIPNIQISSPPGVVKTWFSVQDRDYCIWIVPDLKYIKNDNGEIIDSVELATLTPGNPTLFGSPEETADGRASGTREISTYLATGCKPTHSFSPLYHLNPISGVIDQESGYVSLAIDRTSKGLDIERYEGFLINPDDNTDIFPEDYLVGGHPCREDLDEKQPVIMVITSQETGRQLILYRYLL